MEAKTGAGNEQIKMRDREVWILGGGNLVPEEKTMMKAGVGAARVKLMEPEEWSPGTDGGAGEGGNGEVLFKAYALSVIR